MSSPALICEVIATPERARALSLPQWEQLVVEARGSGLLAKLHHLLLTRGHTCAVPERVMVHLESARRIADEQHVALALELTQLRSILAATDCPLVLLKGCAYVRCKLDAGGGRLFSDIDILVPREHLASVESALMLTGWVSVHRDAYDQRYYRQWMHEIPPMQHIRRATTLDIHHAITPLTSRINADSGLMLSSAQRIDAGEPWFALDRQDMVLHSATHLFLESELDKGLRDLADLFSLLTEFGTDDPHFVPQLVARARAVRLERPLFYALRYLERHFDYRPDPVALSALRDEAPAAWQLKVLDAAFDSVFRPYSRVDSNRFKPLAAFILFVRGHWLRMPLHLLVWHLGRKALMTKPKKKDNDVQDQTDDMP
jgi:hypothetical protein